MAKNILEIKNLTFSFHTYGGVVKSAILSFPPFWFASAVSALALVSRVPGRSTIR